MPSLTQFALPLQSILLGRLVKAAGFPPGVINIVSGSGKTGSLLASHMQIRKISFTGSTAAGRKVQATAAASNLKVVTLELGGKSPSIVFEDANIEKSVETVVLSSLINMGQVCTVSPRVTIAFNFRVLPVSDPRYLGEYSTLRARVNRPRLLGTFETALRCMDDEARRSDRPQHPHRDYRRRCTGQACHWTHRDR